MKVDVVKARRDSLSKPTNHVMVSVSPTEAAALIQSLAGQLSKEDPNTGRLEFRPQGNASYFSIFIDYEGLGTTHSLSAALREAEWDASHLKILLQEAGLMGRYLKEKKARTNQGGPMKRQLRIDIECGADSCASKPGEFCQYVVVTRFGTCYHCQLFSKMGEGKHGLEQLKEKKGWLQRHPDCLGSEMVSVVPTDKYRDRGHRLQEKP